MNTDTPKPDKDIAAYVQEMRNLTEAANKEAMLSINLEVSNSTFVPNQTESKLAVQHLNTISGQFFEYLGDHKLLNEG